MINRNLDILASVPLFAGLAKKELRHLLNETQEERFPAGKVIVTEGGQGGRFFVIVSGRASVISGKKVIATLGSGDSFGEVSIIDKGPRTATVKAETELRALTITSWNFLALLEENWTMTRKILVQLCDRIRRFDVSPTN